MRFTNHTRCYTWEVQVHVLQRCMRASKATATDGDGVVVEQGETHANEWRNRELEQGFHRTGVVKRLKDRLAVGDTDIGRDLREQISDLERLLAAYRNGEIIEKL